MSGNEGSTTMDTHGSQRRSVPVRNIPTDGNDKNDIVNKDYFPNSNGEIVQHTYYTLSYREDHELAEWVAYDIDRKKLNVPNLGRYNRFNPDPMISTGSATHGDYSGSGYTRGHMVPAGDMAFEITAMQESFYMSNMCPQVREFNNGVWKELEENIRDWTYKADRLIIITGPILSDPIKKIGRNQNRITVPSAFYKVLYDTKNEEGIGFIIPHQRSEERLQTYMVSIDEVEKYTGLNFFANYFSDAKEVEIESSKNPGFWNISEKRYQLRIQKWNWE
jgi:endonuclease G